MKLTAIILLSACLTVSASGDAQQVNLSLKNAPLETAFKEIGRQTGYNFLFTYGDLAKAKSISLELKNASLDEALQLIFKEQPLSYTIVDKVVVVKLKYISPNVEATIINEPPPPIDVTGRVTDSTGAPLQGASVIVKGTKQGTRTDANGYFTLKGVDENATIEISYQGFELYSVKASANLGVVRLKMSENAIEEVVLEANTGYQKVKPNETNGSVFVVTNEMLNQQVGTDILQRLDGMVPGLVFNVGKNNSGLGPTYNTKISIRGLNTINGSLDPVIVLDNFIYNGDLTEINPNEVENITILRDAAATSIYGAKGANGVIIITTKKGKFNQKLKIATSSTFSILEKPDLFPNRISSEQSIEIEQFLFGKGFFNSAITSLARPALTPAVEIFLQRQNGVITSADSAAQINALKAIDGRAQLLKYAYRNQFTQQHNITMTGGSKEIAWLLSTSMDLNNNSIVGNNRSRFNLRTNTSYKPIKNLQLDLSLAYIWEKSITGNLPVESSIGGRYVPYYQLADAQGDALRVDRYRRSFIDTIGGGRLLDWTYYPLNDYKLSTTKNIGEAMILSFGLKYIIIKSLDVDLSYQYLKDIQQNETFNDPTSYYARNLINNFSQINYTTGVVTNHVPKGGTLKTSNASSASTSGRIQLNFNKKVSDHSISSILGSEIREFVTPSVATVNYFGYYKDPFSFKIPSPGPFPSIFGGTMMVPDAQPSILTALKTDRFIGVFANAAYVFKQKYSISGSARKDASNTFGLNTNDKWNPLWHAGIGWEISKEKFFKSKLLPLFKVRMTWGYSGNLDESRTASAILRYSTSVPIVGYPYPLASILSLNNPELRWEKTRQFDLSIDFSLTQKSIVTGSLSFYQKKGKDLYGPSPLDYTTSGLNETIKNIATMQGRGIDFRVTTNNLRRIVKWTTSINVSYNVSKVTSYYTTNAEKGSGMVTNGNNSIYPVIGKPLYTLVAYKWGGLNSSGDPMGYLNGNLSKDYSAISAEYALKGLNNGPSKYIGPSVPPVFGSVVNTVSWKALSFSSMISYRLGYYFRRNFFFSSQQLVVSGVGHKDFEKRWQKPGDELVTNIPSFNYPISSTRDEFYQFSEVNVDKADHIRLQYINIGYTWHNRKGRGSFSDVGLTMNISNLGVLWKANKFRLDPDYQEDAPKRQYSVTLRATL